MHVVVKVPAFSGLLAVLLHLLCPSVQGAAQLEALGTWPGQTRGEWWWDAVVRDGLVFVPALTGGLQVVDASDPENPRRHGELYGIEQFRPRYTASSGELLAYTDGEFFGWGLISLTNTASPVLLSRTNATGHANSIAMEGSLVAVAGYDRASREDRLEFWDVSDPAAPTLASRIIVTNGTPDAVVLHAGLAYVGGYNYGLKVFDVSTPSAPVLLSVNTNLNHASRLRLDAAKSRLWSMPKLQVADVSDPQQVGWLTNVVFPPGIQGPNDVLPVNGLLLVAASTNLHVLEASDLTAISVLGTLPLGGSPGRLQRVSDSVVAVTVLERGLVLVDVSDPARPHEASSIGGPGFTRSVRPRDTWAYVADNLQLSVLDARNPAAPVLALPAVQGLQPYSVSDVVVHSNRLHVAHAGAQVAIFDLATPASPARVTNQVVIQGGEWIGRSSPGSLAFADPLLVTLASRGGSMTQLAYRDINHPAANWQSRSLPLGIGGDLLLTRQGEAYKAAYGTGNRIYLDEGVGLFFGNVRSNLALPGPLRGLTQANGRVYAVSDTGGLMILEPSGNAGLALLTTNATAAPPRGVTVHWPYAFVAEGFAGVEVFDISNPLQVRRLAQGDTPGEAVSTTLEGDLLYVADGARGVTILRWASGRQPQTITPPPLLTRVTNSPPFALAATASSGLPVGVRILNGPLAAVGDLFRTTNAAFTSPLQTNKVVNLRFETPGNDSYEPAFLDASFDVVRQPSPGDRYGNWILFNHPTLSAAQMHWRADPDGDGAANEQEFVFGGDPTVADAGHGRLSPPRVEFDGTRWVVRFAATVNPAYASGFPRVIPEVAPAANGPWSALPSGQHRLEGDQIVISLPLEEAVTARLVRLRLQQF